MLVPIPARQLQPGMLERGIPPNPAHVRTFQGDPKAVGWTRIDLSDRLTFLVAVDALYKWAFPEYTAVGTLNLTWMHFGYWVLEASNDVYGPSLCIGDYQPNTTWDRFLLIVKTTRKTPPQEVIAAALVAAWGNPDAQEGTNG